MRIAHLKVALTCGIALFVHPAMAEDLEGVVNPRGQPLTVLVDLPRGEGKFPAVVLAPGQGYHMALPALETTARALVEQGVAVFRFNWAYFTAEPKGRPSDDLSKELQDFQSVLAVARKHPHVDPRQMAVGGKSLGSLVAWRAFAADPTLRSALLLTPVCSRVPKGETQRLSEAKENYPAFELERRPTLWVSGNQDPLCAPSVLYGFAAPRADVSARVAIVGGDHGYEIKATSAAATENARARNLNAVSILSASFIAETVAAQP